MAKIRGFFEELRRRRVFRVVALYIVGAWVLLQAADLAFPGMGIPEASIRYVWIGTIAGLPLALILGWRFDMSGGRIVRTPALQTTGNARLQRTDYALLAVLGAAAAAISLGMIAEIRASRAPPARHERAAGIDDKSIAILPFRNFSGDVINDPLTVGIHDDLLTHVSKISDIKVISRTSVSRLDPDLSIPDISRLLGVATILEGGVQRTGNRLRINAQLIDGATDQHLWAETFDKEMTTQDIFAIQTEIAAAIADELRATLSQRDRDKLGKIPTQSLPAYEAYLLGKQRMTTRARADLLQAIEYFETSIALDPSYALAHVGLADTNLLLNSYGHLPLDEMLETTGPALAAALALDDQLGAAFASTGLSKLKQGDRVGAEAAYQRAMELDPNYPTTYHWYGNMLLDDAGRPDEAVRLLEKARELDPLSPAINITLGEALGGLGRFEEAMALFEKALEIEPDYPGAYFLIGTYHHTVYGRLDEAVRWQRLRLSIEPGADTSILAFIYLDLGDDIRAEQWVEQSLRHNPDGFFGRSVQVFLHRFRGEEAQALEGARRLLALYPDNNSSLVTFVTYGRYEEALESLDRYPELSCSREPVIDRNNLFQAMNLSLALQETGQGECAERILRAILDRLRDIPRLGPRGFGILDVEVHARLGNTRLALNTLRKAIDQGFRAYWWAQGETSVHMGSLREHPEFRLMMDEMRAEMALQRQKAREFESGVSPPS